VVLCGVQSEMCVGATARSALARGLRAVLPHDAHGTYDIPAVVGLAELVPAHHLARVAEWALGDEVEIITHARDVEFIEAIRP
jgi:nicotinamidase-related amidase